MIPKEILKKIKQIEIRTGRLVNEVFSGQYASVFKGRGMEFSEVREYEAGDDIRSIDWNVTARYGRPFIKKFVEERELTIVFLVDASASQYFGTQEKLKSEIAAEMAAVLSFSALRHNDRVGMIIFTDEIEKYIVPRKGRSHILRIIREILYFKPTHRQTDLEQALEFLNEVCRKKAVVFIISDFKDKGYEKLLRITHKRHDVTAIVLSDPREQELSAAGFMELEDSETGEVIEVNLRNKTLRENYLNGQQKERERLKKMFQTMGMDQIPINTAQDYVKPLITFFRARERRFR